MEIDIKITSFEVEINPVIRNDDLKAFVKWYFISDVGKIKLVGGTIKVKTFGKNNVKKLSFDGPAIRTRGGNFFKVFYLPDLDIYKKLCQYTIDEYIKVAGELPEGVIIDSGYEEVNPEDIPF
jgi:hypothetical protein